MCFEALKEKLLKQVRQRRIERRGEAPSELPEPTVPLERGPMMSLGLGWSQEDEHQQQEALRSIQNLRRRQEPRKSMTNR